MTKNTEFASMLLEKGAPGYAGLAASLLLENLPDNNDPNELNNWKGHITQRILELSAALSVSQPQLFANRVAWFRKALIARSIDEKYVMASLNALRETLNDRLPEVGKQAPLVYIDHAIAELTSGTAILDELEPDPDTPTGKQTLNYLQSVLEGNSASAIDELLEALNHGQDAATLYTQVLLPAQREVGRLWHLGDLSIGEEHLVTTTTQRAMSVLAQTSGNREPNGKTIIAASVATNAHDIGVRAIADLYQMAGWRAIYLGSDVPVPDMPPMVTYYDADILVLSATLDVQIPQVKKTIQEVRLRCENQVKILVGGYAFDQAPEIAASVGADAYTTSVIAAVETGIKLTES
ncbi:MAG: cobalamin-dependent protein [Gammaproteobacteria bacterium]|nr:cobalamin-dependent protein [Gammaproteobacteria bacterium]